MPEALRVEAVTQAARLKPYGKTLTDAATHYLAHLEAVERTCTVSELIVEFNAAKKKDGARDLYLKDLKNRLARFEIEFGERKVAEVRTQEIDDWLRALDSAAQTRNNFRTCLRTLFEFAVVRAYAPENPVERTAKAKVVRGAPAIFTPKNFAALLEHAHRDLVPWLAIGGFAGLRSAEIERLDWAEIDLSRRLIHVKAEKAKSAQRRRNLAAPDAKWRRTLCKKF